MEKNCGIDVHCSDDLLYRYINLDIYIKINRIIYQQDLMMIFVVEMTREREKDFQNIINTNVSYFFFFNNG